MKFNKNLLLMAVAALTMHSCTDDDNQSYSVLIPNALVTVKATDDNATYFQLDENTTLYPENIKTELYDGKQVRALMNFTELDKVTPGFTKTVQVNWIDSIRTKDMVALSETVTNEWLGNDPVDIVNDWVTIAEDGYLTLRLRMPWYNRHSPHNMNLLGHVNPENPFEVELRHNAHGDTFGPLTDSMIAFRLNEIPAEIPEGQELTVKWKTLNGIEKTVNFKILK